MNVLILTQYFTPEIGATQTRLHSFAAGLSERGHHVRVICEVPNHPQGIVHDGFRRRAAVRRRFDGFSAVYVYVHTRPQKTRRTRLAFYTSYTAMAAIVGASMPGPDIVLASSPPLPVGVAAAFVARRHRVPWVLDVRDLWPEAAIALGELSPGRALRAAERLERWLYRDATAISAVTSPFVEAICERTRPDKVHLVPNGTTQFWLGGDGARDDRAEVGLPSDRFVWTFAGNIGHAQGLDAAVDAVRLLGDGFQLRIIGDGPARNPLEARTAGLPADAVVFSDQMSPEEARRRLLASDALLVSLAPDPILASFVPSKLFDFCALGRPVILAAAGEPQRLTAIHHAALAVEPGNAEALAATVRRLSNDAALCQRLSAAGRRFAESNLRDHHLDILEQLLAMVAQRQA